MILAHSSRYNGHLNTGRNTEVVCHCLLQWTTFCQISPPWPAKYVQTTLQLCSLPMLVRVCSKAFKLGFSSTWIENFQMYKLDLEKAEEPEIKLPTSTGLQKKQENSRKISASSSLPMLKHLTVWITINCGKFWKRWEYQTTWPASSEICMQVRKQQLELDTEQQTGSK